ncbi:protein AATF-like [Homarus americanus]|uniref:protein AATF-like n=1 Tax=Homarus americanus TaxID=6706 RepID=UPI001C45AE09|nr:protein AATF-like [Homarus americanus]
MASDLKSYVEKYLLNPAASFSVDDDGNQETKAQVVDALAEEERADSTRQPVSKLRARSAALQGEKDPRYKGKKVLRKDLNKDDQIEFDPELTKYFAVEADEDTGEDDDDDEDDDEEEEDDEEEKDEESSLENETDDEVENLAVKLKKANTAIEEDDEGSESEDDTIKKIHKQLKKEPEGVTFVDDGDFSKFADDMDEEDDEGDDDEDDNDDDDEGDDDEDDEGDEDMEEEADGQEDSLKKFSIGDQCEEVKKGQAVKNQLAIYDTLFEGRIGLQKVVTGTNQLPQYDTYKKFVQECDPHYNKNLITAKSAAKNLLNSLLNVQELLLRQNSETSYIITGKKPKHLGTDSDEEVTSSEEEEEKEVLLNSRGTKRKMKLEEYDEVLSKRHAAMVPFRDQAVNKWYEKTKLLSSRNARDKFSGFQVSALQQLNNILANKQPLIRRTQLTGATRGITYHILGRSDNTVGEVDKEEYDPEIFDDTDFYTRSLEEVLKAKVSLSDNMTDVSRKWIEIQNLRKKAKRKVDKKASKGRKIRYQVMSKLQQYLAPCYPPWMDDSAINTLFASLFGKSVQEVKEVDAQ